MAIVRGAFQQMWRKNSFYDSCSPIRHFFAKLGLCKHEGEWLTLKQFFDKCYVENFKELYPSTVFTDKQIKEKLGIEDEEI